MDDTIAGTNFSTSFTFDSVGRVSTRTHPSGIVETLGYNGNGFLATISAGGLTRYTVISMNAREQLTGATYGSNLAATFGVDSYGYPNASSAGSLQDYRYAFDPVTGNLDSRQNFKRSLSENFSYTDNLDNLDRLTSVSGPRNLAMTYAANGNILTKSDISSSTAFTYGDSTGPYALTGVTSSTGVIPAINQTATYTSSEKVTTLNEDACSATFVYNSQNQRAKMEVSQNETNILTRWYAGSSFMKETAGGVTKEFTYIGGDAYTAPVAAVTQAGTTTFYYLLRDYLGNITHLVNTSNQVVAEYNFDAWGRRRSADDWSYTLDANDLELFAGRGFTAHETLPWFNLVNMNGRLYDPLVGRFLSPDPFVQLPDYTQNLNRYSYALNNPLKYTDPDGEWIWIPLMIIGAYIGGVSNNHGELNPASWNWKDEWTYISMFVGGATGALGGYGIMNPGTVGLSLGASSPYVAAGITATSGAAVLGQGTNWNFDLHWSTVAGGGGQIGLNGNPPSAEQIVNQEITQTKKSYMEVLRDDLKKSHVEYFGYSSGIYSFLFEFGMGIGDFNNNYIDMREANWKFSDKYFHAKANFQASHRGPGGEFFAIHFSNLREIWDQNIKKYPFDDSILDQEANRYGREQAKYFEPYDYRKALKKYRPNRLPFKY